MKQECEVNEEKLFRKTNTTVPFHFIIYYVFIFISLTDVTLTQLNLKTYRD